MPTVPIWCRPRLSHLKACEQDAWHLEIWKRDNPDERRVIPFRCRSWRCAGDCRLWRGAQDFRRIEEAIGKRNDWTYCVFTYDQREWPDTDSMYRGGLAIWAKLRKRIGREFGRFDYIQTWEAHRSGAPHVNVLLGNGNLADAACDDWRSLRRQWIRPAAMSCGFGKVVWVEPMRDRTRMAGYLVKLANELTGAEEKGQTPVNAPRHFRRLRASRGLLPPCHKDPELTGVLHRHLPGDGNECRCCLQSDPFAGTLVTSAKGRKPRAKG